MKIELQEQLFHRYPRFLRKPPLWGTPDLDPQVAGPLDYWGIQCGDGWYELLDNLLQQYEAHIQELIGKGTPKERWPRAVQIKEKFGKLCFYVYGRGNLPSALIDATGIAEMESEYICETCGRPGCPQTSGYLCVVCDDCRQQPSARLTDAEMDAQLVRLRSILDARED